MQNLNNKMNALEEKFKKIDAKLSSNAVIHLINKIYDKDVNRIEKFFNSEHQKYENGLNKCRDEMLKQLISQRDAHLNQVNGFVQRMGENHQKNLNKLRRLDDSIKSNFLVFARGLASVNESDLV